MPIIAINNCLTLLTLEIPAKWPSWECLQVEVLTKANTHLQDY
jgi:hypothetical protein